MPISIAVHSGAVLLILIIPLAATLDLPEPEYAIHSSDAMLLVPPPPPPPVARVPTAATVRFTLQ